MSQKGITICDVEECEWQGHTTNYGELPPGWWHSTLDLGMEEALYVRVELHLCPDHAALSRRDPGWLVQRLTSLLDSRYDQRKREHEEHLRRQQGNK